MTIYKSNTNYSHNNRYVSQKQLDRDRERLEGGPNYNMNYFNASRSDIKTPIKSGVSRLSKPESGKSKGPSTAVMSALAGAENSLSGASRIASRVASRTRKVVPLARDASRAATSRTATARRGASRAATATRKAVAFASGTAAAFRTANTRRKVAAAERAAEGVRTLPARQAAALAASEAQAAAWPANAEQRLYDRIDNAAGYVWDGLESGAKKLGSLAKANITRGRSRVAPGPPPGPLPGPPPGPPPPANGRGASRIASRPIKWDSLPY